MTQVVLLRGAPGVGKSTTLLGLRDQLVGGAVIDVDHVWGMLGGAPYDASEYVLALEQTSLLVRGFLARGRSPVVVASPFEADALGAMVELLDGLRVRTLALVAESEELTRRIYGRPSWGFRDLEVAHRVNASLWHGGAVLDTTALAPGEVLSAVLKRFRGTCECAAETQPSPPFRSPPEVGRAD